MVVALVTLAACGGDAPAAQPLRSYTMRLHAEDNEDRYRFVSDDPVDVRVGDEVTFVVRNDGSLPHDLQVVAPWGETIGKADPVPSGATLSVTARFDEPGRYRLNCLVDDHLTAHRMQAIVEVTAPDEG